MPKSRAERARGRGKTPTKRAQRGAQKVARRARPDWFWWLVGLVAVAAIWFGIHQSKAGLWGLKLDFIYLTLASGSRVERRSPIRGTAAARDERTPSGVRRGKR